MYFPQDWEFGSAFQNFGIWGGGGVNPPNPSPVPHWLDSNIWYIIVTMLLRVKSGVFPRIHIN
jgi:hypothetical protein